MVDVCGDGRLGGGGESPSPPILCFILLCTLNSPKDGNKDVLAEAPSSMKRLETKSKDPLPFLQSLFQA